MDINSIAANETLSNLMNLLTLTSILCIYLLPTIIAYRKRHTHLSTIALVNIFGTLFFGFGWIISLIWSLTKAENIPVRFKSGIADELEKLHELKLKGVLSQEEFDSQKKALLKSG